MKDLVRRRWFFLLLLAGLLLSGLCPDWLRPATVWLDPRLLVAVSLFLMAWGLESLSLFETVRRPGPALWALAISYGGVPLLAWAAGWLLAETDLRLGLRIIAAVPCTLASAVLWTRMAGGNEATALLTVLLTTATSWLITPAWLTLATRTQVALEMPAMMRGLALVLVLPVALGQLCRALPPLRALAKRYKPLFGVSARLCILSIILKAAVDVGDRVAERSVPLSLPALALALGLCVATHLGALAAGLWSSRLLRFSWGNQVAVAFACSQKTLPVSLYLFDVYFQAAYPLAVLPLVFYHVGQLVVDTFLADTLVRGPAKGYNKHQGQASIGNRENAHP